VADVGAGVTEFEDAGPLVPGIYRYRVAADGVAGRSAFESSPNVDFTLPTDPTNVNAVIYGPASIRVTWTKGSDNTVDFEIERRVRNPDGPWSQVGIVPVSLFTNTGLTPNTQYEYRVRARNGVGNSGFVTSPVVNFSAPAVATSFTASPTGPTTAHLSWTDNATNETSYVLARRLGNAPYVTIATLPANTTSYDDSGLSSGSNYQYRLRATNPVGFNQVISPAITTP
jgi:titin